MNDEAFLISWGCILGFCLLAMGLCRFYSIRNYHVFHYRNGVIESGNGWQERYQRLPNYNHMLWRQPFRWDWSDYERGDYEKGT